MSEPDVLAVDRVALTTLRVPDQAGAHVLYPAVAVWADLGLLREAGIFLGPEDGRLNVVQVTQATLSSENPAVVEVTVADSLTVQMSEEPADLAGFTLPLPSSYLGLTLALSTTPLDLRILLVDGPSPQEPETHTLDLDQVGVVIVLDPEVLHAPLHQVMAPMWDEPLRTVTDGHHEDEVADPMRDMLWATSSGVALGQVPAFNRLLTFAQWAANQFTESQADQEAITAATGRTAALLGATENLLLSSKSGQVLFADDGTLLLPAVMAPLVEQVLAEVDMDAAQDCVNGALLEDLVNAYGLDVALPAVVVVAAVAAHAAMASGVLGEGRFTVAFVLGTWIDEDGEEPWWAVRATLGLLLHHDTEVLADLLATRLAAADGEELVTQTAQRFLHVLVEALDGIHLEQGRVLSALAQHEIRPRNLPDALHVARVLLEKATEIAEEGQMCPGCGAVDHLVATIIDQDRLAAAAVTLLPMLADLDAEVAGFPVGDHDWVAHRNGWLAHWLQHTALSADDD